MDQPHRLFLAVLAAQRPVPWTKIADAPGQVTVAATAQADLSSFVSRNDCLRVEVLWALKIVNSHFSYNSCTDVAKVFQAMFPDSEIARLFSFGEKT